MGNGAATDGMLPETAKELRVGLEVDARVLAVRYAADGGPPADLRLTYPMAIDDLPPSVLGSIAAGVAVYLGQLCLAPTIELDLPLDPGAVDGLRPIAAMLYGIRCWKDERPLVAPPEMVVTDPRPAEPSAATLDPERATLLFSGGKDSTLSALVLARNGLAVEAVHVGANQGVDAAEAASVRRLAARLRLPVTTLGYAHDDFTAFSGRYARHWAAFPHFNAVPFGRDLVLSLAAMPLALARGTRFLSLGHDHVCRNAYVDYEGHRIPRNDIESAEGALALERYIRAFVASDARMLPPLAQATEFRVLRELFVEHPELMGETSFCFWGGNCGRCAKCMRYFLAQRVFGREGTLSFATNPLAAGACPELDDILASWGRESVLFDREVIYMLGRLVERGDVRDGEEALRRFADEIHPSVAASLDEWEEELLRLGDDPQVPPAFAFASARRN